MTDYLLLFVGTVLVNNFVLVKFLGLCPFMGVSKKLETAMGMGLATTFVMTLASICAWLIDTWILIPLNLIYLRTGVYSGDCCGCAVHRDGGAQNQPGALPSAGDFFAAYHHQLCSARRGVAEYQSRAQFLAVGAVRFFRRCRFLAGDGALRRHPRTPCCG